MGSREREKGVLREIRELEGKNQRNLIMGSFFEGFFIGVFRGRKKGNFYGVIILYI